MCCDYVLLQWEKQKADYAKNGTKVKNFQSKKLSLNH
ncbi:hypothetical protein ALON55S_03762 [Alishewanella longhuensis]